MSLSEIEAIGASAALIFVAAITPGPNNLIVLRIAAGQGLRSALPAMAGVVVGGLAMFLLGQIGLAALVHEHPWLSTAMMTCGAAYLAWLGIDLVRSSFVTLSPSAPLNRNLPQGAFALLAFQFANPKSWILVLTVTAAAQSAAAVQSVTTTVALVALFVVIPCGCLLAWAALGRAAARMILNPTSRARFDRAMGSLLAASAIFLLIHR
jgi:threonine/homoserine/homoserine lactone efflux protein